MSTERQSPPTPSGTPARTTLNAKPKGVCLNREKKLLCAWPRCDCRVDLVYMTDCRIPRPKR